MSGRVLNVTVQTFKVQGCSRGVPRLYKISIFWLGFRANRSADNAIFTVNTGFIRIAANTNALVFTH